MQRKGCIQSIYYSMDAKSGYECTKQVRAIGEKDIGWEMAAGENKVDPRRMDGSGDGT